MKDEEEEEKEEEEEEKEERYNNYKNLFKNDKNKYAKYKDYEEDYSSNDDEERKEKKKKKMNLIKYNKDDEEYSNEENKNKKFLKNSQSEESNSSYENKIIENEKKKKSPKKKEKGEEKSLDEKRTKKKDKNWRKKKKSDYNLFDKELKKSINDIGLKNNLEINPTKCYSLLKEEDYSFINSLKFSNSEEEFLNRPASKEKKQVEELYISNESKYQPNMEKNNLDNKYLKKENKIALHFLTDIIPSEEEYFFKPRKDDFNYLAINIKNTEDKDINHAVKLFMKNLKDKIKEEYDHPKIKINFDNEKDNEFIICYKIQPIFFENNKINFLDETFEKKVKWTQNYGIKVKLIEGNKSLYNLNKIQKYYLLFCSNKVGKEDFYEHLKILKKIAKNILLNL